MNHVPQRTLRGPASAFRLTKVKVGFASESKPTPGLLGGTAGPARPGEDIRAVEYGAAWDNPPGDSGRGEPDVPEDSPSPREIATTMTKPNPTAINRCSVEGVSTESVYTSMGRSAGGYLGHAAQPATRQERSRLIHSHHSDGGCAERRRSGVLKIFKIFLFPAGTTFLLNPGQF